VADEIVSIRELADFVGVDTVDETLCLINSLRDFSIEDICTSTGIDWTKRRKLGRFNEALRTKVYISYYAVRDASKNTPFLQEYLTGLICSLQLSAHEGACETDSGKDDGEEETTDDGI
jgi:hypothetical protein